MLQVSYMFLLPKLYFHPSKTENKLPSSTIAHIAQTGEQAAQCRGAAAGRLFY